MKTLLKISIFSINTFLLSTLICSGQEHQIIVPASMTFNIHSVLNNTNQLIKDERTLLDLHNQSALCGGRLLLAKNQFNQLCPLISFARDIEESEIFVSLGIMHGDALCCTNVTAQIKKVLNDKERYGYNPESLGIALFNADQKALSDAQLPMFNNLIQEVPVFYPVHLPSPVHVLPYPLYIPMPYFNPATSQQQQEQPVITQAQTIEVNSSTPLEKKEEKVDEQKLLITPTVLPEKIIDEALIKERIESFSEKFAHQALNAALVFLKEKKDFEEREIYKKQRKKNKKETQEITNFIINMFNTPIALSHLTTQKELNTSTSKLLNQEVAPALQINDKKLDDSETPTEQKNPKKKKKKKNKQATQDISHDINDDISDDEFEETLSDIDFATMIANIATYNLIQNREVQLNEENLDELMSSIDRFFNVAHKSKDKAVIDFLDEDSLQTGLRKHAEACFLQNKRINFCYSSALLYCLYLVDKLERKKETLTFDEIMHCIKDFKKYYGAKYIFVHQQDEYSGDTLIASINKDYKNLVPKNIIAKIHRKELHDLAIEQKYVDDYVTKINDYAVLWLPHCIEKILPETIDTLITIPRSQEETFKEYSQKIELLILDILSIIENLNNEIQIKKFTKSLRKTLLQKDILSYLIKDTTYTVIKNFVHAVEMPADPENLVDLFLRYYSERLGNKSILMFLKSLKQGIYGNPLILLENLETAVPLFVLFSLPEMADSKKILIAALVNKKGDRAAMKKLHDVKRVAEKFKSELQEKNLIDK